MMDSVALAYLRYNISCQKMEVSWYRTMRREICIKPLRLNPSSPGCLAVITVRQMQRIAQWHFYCAASWELRFWIIALLSEKKQLLWSVIKLLAPPHRDSSALLWFTIRHCDKNREIGWNGEWTISNLTPFSCKIGQTSVLFSFILPCCSCCFFSHSQCGGDNPALCCHFNVCTDPAVCSCGMLLSDLPPREP